MPALLGSVAGRSRIRIRNYQRFDQWNRKRLVGVGADIVIPDYLDATVLLDVIEGK